VIDTVSHKLTPDGLTTTRTTGPGERLDRPVDGIPFAKIGDLDPALLEQVYRQFKNRLLDEARVDPILAHILTTSPEISVEVERRDVRIDGDSLKGRLAQLIAAGFFDATKPAREINKELNRTGGEVNSGNLSRALGDFRKDGFVTEESDGFVRAPGLKVSKRSVTTE